MSVTKEWQLVAHAPKLLTVAQGSVAVAIARRIKESNQTEPIPQRTLVLESVGVSSRSTVQSALAQLKLLGIIRVKSYPGSRRPDLITWALECPKDCQIDHEKGNSKKAKSPTPIKTSLTEDRSTTLTVDRSSLTGNKKREDGVLSFVQDSLELSIKSDDHLALIEALKDPLKREAVRAIADDLADKARNGEAYLRAITRDSPRDLMPPATKPKPAPDYSHLPESIQEILNKEDAAR